MSIGEIKKRIERTDADVPTKLPVEERKERMDRLRVRLPGLEIKGHLEPSHSLVDLMVQMLEQGVLKYVPWSSCTCREQEVLGTKKADVGTTIVPLSNGLLKTQKADHCTLSTQATASNFRMLSKGGRLQRSWQALVTTTPCSC
jgi:hypothetical protein